MNKAECECVCCRTERKSSRGHLQAAAVDNGGAILRAFVPRRADHVERGMNLMALISANWLIRRPNARCLLLPHMQRGSFGASRRRLGSSSRTNPGIRHVWAGSRKKRGNHGGTLCC